MDQRESNPKRWTLRHGDDVLGLIDVRSFDQPWYEGEFTPLQGFSLVKPYFDKDLVLLEQEKWDEFEQLWDDLRSTGIVIENTHTGQRVSDFILHIEGSRAWFRY